MRLKGIQGLVSAEGAAAASSARGESFEAFDAPVVICPDDYLFDGAGKYRYTDAGYAKAIATSVSLYEQDLIRPDVEKAVLLIGVPGAGKSTYVSQHAAPGIIYFDEAQLLTRESRQPYLALAAKHGVPIEIVWVDTPLHICLARNRQRPQDRRVPEHLIVEWHGVLARQALAGREGVAKVIRVAGC